MPSAIRRVGRTNVWLATSEDNFVLRAHPTAGVGESGDVTRYGTSGLAALAIAGLPHSSGDVMTQVEEAIAWVHDLLILLRTDWVPSPMPLLNGDSCRRIGNVVWETLSFMLGELVGDHPTPDQRELGRPAPNVPRIDLDRLRAFVAGYCTVRPLDDVERAAIPVYLRARGLQMLAKRTRLRIADKGPLEQVRWIRAHHDQLVRILQARDLRLQFNRLLGGEDSNPQ